MFNSRKEYVTRDVNDGGFDYRTIADIMTARGCAIGHSTVRNCINRTMERIACALMVMSGVTGDPSELAKSVSFQRHVEELFHEIYAEQVIALDS